VRRPRHLHLAAGDVECGPGGAQLGIVLLRHLHDFRHLRQRRRKARLTLAVLVFPRFSQDFSVVDDLHLAPDRPARGLAGY
jgi:hypothetical protein